MKDDALFPSDNELGIPELLMEAQAAWVESPCRAWGSCSRERKHPGTWHFYTEDYRWSSLWNNPWKLTHTEPIVCTEPNYSIQENTPPALAIEKIYRKRWLARYWQAAGIKTIVDLYVPQRHQEINLLGVPLGWSSYSTRGADSDLDGLKADHEIAMRHAKESPLVFVVIGGGSRVADWCQGNRALHIPYARTKRAYSGEIDGPRL